MSGNYEIYADEAWTHNNPPLRRYWCFVGGVAGSQSDLDRLDKRLQAVKLKCGHTSEIKWAKLDPHNHEFYKEFLDEFFNYLKSHKIQYRQVFLDRSFVHYDSYKTNPSEMYNLDVQFKVYYQFIKHHFGLKFLPKEKIKRVVIHFDNHSSKKHKTKLESFVNDLPRLLERPDLQFSLFFSDSRDNLRIQACDLLMGAAGSNGNQMELIRQPQKKGETIIQKLRKTLAKKIYDDLRSVSCEERGSKAFNWFESTGQDEPESALTHKIRIWKFKPKKFLKDKGFENDHLAKDGSYVGPVLKLDQIQSASGREILD